MSDAKILPLRRPVNGTPAAPGEPPPNALAHPPAALPPGMPPVLAVFIPDPQVAQAIRQNLIEAFRQDPKFCEAVTVVRTNLMAAKTDRHFQYAIVLLDPRTPDERALADEKSRKLLV